MKFNKIKTDAEYLEEGFTPAELPLIRATDLMFNDCVANDGWRSKKIEKRYYELCEQLGL